MIRTIHPTAFIALSARLGPGVVIGPNVVIEEDVVVGAYSIIGGTPEHRGFFGADRADGHLGVVLAAGCRIFEFVTIHGGTERPTTIGTGAAVFNHSHVAHDCWIGPEAIVGGQVSLAGHTVLERNAIVSGKSCTHQFSVLGAYSFLGAASYLRGNVPPGEKWMGNPAREAGANEIGLERAGLTFWECKAKYDADFVSAVTGKKWKS